MDNIIAVIISAPFLLFVVYISISGIIGAIQNAILRKKEFNPEVKLRLETEIKEKDEFHQKEIVRLKNEYSQEVSKIHLACNQEISKAKSDAERRVSEYAANAQFRESQLDHQIFTLKAENQALTKEIQKMKTAFEKEKAEIISNVENRYVSRINDLSIREQAVSEAEKHLNITSNLYLWHETASDMIESVKGDLPKAFMDDKLIDSYITSMKTMSLPKALREKMKIEIPILVSAKIHSANSNDIYTTTLTSCTCRASQKPCKHMIALALKTKSLTPYDLKLKYEIKQFGLQVHYDVMTKNQAKEDRKKAGQYLATCKDIEKIINEKKLYYPWLAELITRYEIAKAPITVKDTRDKRKLTKEITACKKEIEQLRSILLVYEKTIPFLAESKDLSPEEFIKKAKSKQ